MTESGYYIMRRKKDETYPLIKILDINSRPMKLTLSNPVPSRPVMADYLSGAEDFVTKRVVSAMQKMDLSGVRFIPTELPDKQGGIIKDYLCINVEENTYEAMDKQKSDYAYKDNCFLINKIILDKNALESIPLNKRLAFRLSEAPGYNLYHKWLVESIRAINPTGVFFQNIEEYSFL